MKNVLLIQKNKIAYSIFVLLMLFEFSCYHYTKMPNSYKAKFTPDTVATNIFDGQWRLESYDSTISIDKSCEPVFVFSGSQITVTGHDTEYNYKGVFKIKDNMSFDYFYIPYYDDIDRYKFKLSESFIYKYFYMTLNNRKIDRILDCKPSLIGWLQNVRGYNLMNGELTFISSKNKKIILKKRTN